MLPASPCGKAPSRERVRPYGARVAQSGTTAGPRRDPRGIAQSTLLPVTPEADRIAACNDIATPEKCASHFDKRTKSAEEEALNGHIESAHLSLAPKAVFQSK